MHLPIKPELIMILGKTLRSSGKLIQSQSALQKYSVLHTLDQKLLKSDMYVTPTARNLAPKSSMGYEQTTSLPLFQTKSLKKPSIYHHAKQKLQQTQKYYQELNFDQVTADALTSVQYDLPILKMQNEWLQYNKQAPRTKMQQEIDEVKEGRPTDRIQVQKNREFWHKYGSLFDYSYQK